MSRIYIESFRNILWVEVKVEIYRHTHTNRLIQTVKRKWNVNRLMIAWTFIAFRKSSLFWWIWCACINIRTKEILKFYYFRKSHTRTHNRIIDISERQERSESSRNVHFIRNSCSVIKKSAWSQRVLFTSSLNINWHIQCI